ncbi:small ribosomal subunit protein uS7-like [Oscarella lobularis]|uniref:small ribosomal subunit protein uS7-like n=1 Tax=Oscarella lobularis TaxID=121494 RepID=UPI0033131774
MALLRRPPFLCAFLRTGSPILSFRFTSSSSSTPPADSHANPSIFYDELANKFVNCMMWDGKKSLSQQIFRRALYDVKKEQTKEEWDSSPLEIFHKAVENAKPVVGITKIRRAGKMYQVPGPLAEKRRRFLAIKWIITAARERPGHGMSRKLALELVDAYKGEGTVIRKKVELHKIAEANRAFAHYRWW